MGNDSIGQGFAGADTGADTGVARRSVLKTGAAFVAAVAALSVVETAALAATAARPHIIYILADDLGWQDIGFRGSDIATPNIDKLAKTGRRLDEFYAQPMCTPTRAAIMTGRYPLRYGLQMGVIPSGADYGLATDEVTLPQTLKQSGYYNAIVGKWHLGHAKKEYWPNQRGFDYAYGPLIGEIDHFKHSSHGVKDWFRNNVPLDEIGYDTELFGNDAVRLINGYDQKAPLFLYLAFTAPHTPYQAPQSYLDRYKHIADPGRRAYAAQITAMDDQIGRVLAALDKSGMRDNALIIFHSDNGGTRSKMFAGEGAVSGELPPSNGPFRDGKGTLYEGGVRVGAVVNWPGRIAPGTSASGIFHAVDMLPTLAAVAGASTARSKPLDGVNVWPAIADGKPSPRTDVVINVESTQGSVRDGDWKLVWLAPLPPQVQLFNLASDRSEKHDVAAANPDKVKALQARVVELATAMVPPLFAMEAIRATLASPPNFGTRPAHDASGED